MFLSEPYVYTINSVDGPVVIYYEIDQFFELSLAQVTCGATNIRWDQTEGTGIAFSQWDDDNTSIITLPEVPSSQAGIWSFDYEISKPNYSTNTELTKRYTNEIGKFVFELDA